ncbi:hypothetical protein [Breoghania sp. L-A4]|uniref:hypothetical protein n=1 Tax=Breoghania sp. L-A4 TaxID=2304600 RepID=UPI000E35E1BA|nr:hypothetical protein [Breoghania sp. L-A4]AXS40683.1 hypothetical protein D1F64_12220 [Breoghania sp. L-A4]
MKQHIRAEDFDIVEDRMILGGRVFEGNSVVFAHVEKRISAELLGFCSAIVICVGVGTVVVSNAPGAAIALFAVAGLLSFGAYREIRRPFVLVVEFYQIGLFEVRGFTMHEVVVVEGVLDELRRGSRGEAWRKSGNATGGAYS